MKRTGFTGYVYNFSVDYEAITVDDIKDIHEYLMKKKKIQYDKYVRTCLKDTSCKATQKNVLFIKKVFHIGSFFLSSLVSTTVLSCISMNNQACNVGPKIINVNSNEPVVLKQVNVVVAVIILMIRTQKYGFLML